MKVELNPVTLGGRAHIWFPHSGAPVCGRGSYPLGEKEGVNQLVLSGFTVDVKTSAALLS